MYNQTDLYVKEQKPFCHCEAQQSPAPCYRSHFIFLFFLDNRPLVCFYTRTLRGIIKAWAEENGKHKEFQLRVLVLLLLCTGLPAA